MLKLGDSPDTQTDDSYVDADINLAKLQPWRDSLKASAIRKLERIAGDCLQVLGYDLAELRSDGPFRALSPLERTLRRQADIGRGLFRAETTTMIDRRLVKIRHPLGRRISRVVRRSANLWLGDSVVDNFRKNPRML